jgi:hypothetical protein
VVGGAPGCEQGRGGDWQEIRGDPDGWGPPAGEREGEGAEVGRRWRNWARLGRGGKKGREGSAGSRVGFGVR